MCLAGGCEATMAQAPTSPVQLTTNTSYLEPSTHLRWTYNGATYGWYQVVDSVTLYTKSHQWRASQTYQNANILVTDAGQTVNSYLSPQGIKVGYGINDTLNYFGISQGGIILDNGTNSFTVGFRYLSGTAALLSDIPSSLPVPNYLTNGYGLIGSPFNGSAAITFKTDSSLLQTVSNFSTKGNTYYYTKTLSDSKYQPLENQRLGTSTSPTFVAPNFTGGATGQTASNSLDSSQLLVTSALLNRRLFAKPLYINGFSGLGTSSSPLNLITASTITQNSVVPVQSGAVYNALLNYIPFATTSQVSFGGISIINTDGTGGILLSNQATTPATPATGTAFLYHTSTGIAWLTSNGFSSTLTHAGITASRVYTLPDATTTLLGIDNTATVTNKNFNSGTNTWPTFNQNTTGSAATLTTPRNIQGVAFDGSAAINPINGTGFVKASGTTLIYDNSTYLTTSSTPILSNFWIFGGGVGSAAIGAGNFGSSGGNSASSTNAFASLNIAGNANVVYRTAFTGSNRVTVGAGYNYGGHIFGYGQVAVNGSINYVNNASFNAPDITITSGGVTYVNNAYFNIPSTIGTNNNSAFFAGQVAYAGSSSGVLTLKVPSTVTSYGLTLPANAGSANYFLQTDGTGVTTWAVPTNSIVSTADLTAQTSTTTICSYTPASTATFSLSSYLTVTAYTSGSLTLHVTWTDENSISQFANIIASPSAIGAFGQQSPLTIRAKSGTTITAAVTGTFSATYDVGARIIQL